MHTFVCVFFLLFRGSPLNSLCASKRGLFLDANNRKLLYVRIPFVRAPAALLGAFAFLLYISYTFWESCVLHVCVQCVLFRDELPAGRFAIFLTIC